jgi:hypothetical protein
MPAKGIFGRNSSFVAAKIGIPALTLSAIE